MMKMEMRLVRHEEQEATMRITMPIAKWRALHQKLQLQQPSQEWPVWQFVSLIGKALREADPVIEQEHEIDLGAE